MKLIIEDKFGNVKVIIDPKFVPRIGDHVLWQYQPAPRVVDVVFNYNFNTIHVTLK